MNKDLVETPYHCRPQGLEETLALDQQRVLLEASVEECLVPQGVVYLLLEEQASPGPQEQEVLEGPLAEDLAQVVAALVLEVHLVETSAQELSDSLLVAVPLALVQLFLELAS